MFRLLFWNLHGERDAGDVVVELCRARGVDLLIVAECPGRDAAMCRSSEARLGYRAFRTDMSVEEVAAYSSAMALRVHCETAGPRPLTVVGVHLPSRLHQRHEEDQRLAAETCRLFVEDRERPEPEGLGHDRTVVIGDFNLDPYAPAMVGFSGLNAMQTVRAASRPRRYGGVTRATFYNPMWSVLGDAEGPAGSFYLRAPGALGYYWHMLDQVLLRGSLVPHLERVQVLDDDHLISRKARIPNVSDHLPIELTLRSTVFGSEAP